MIKTKPDDYVTGTTPGKRLTKREYFAAMALQGLLSEAAYYSFNKHNYAIEAVKHADALIETLNKPQDGKETK